MAKAFFCSEDMELCQLVLHEEHAFNCLSEVGHSGGMQFNNVYDEDRILNNNFTSKLMLCHDLIRIVEYLESHMSSLGIVPVYYPNVDTEQRPRESLLPSYEQQLLRLYAEMKSLMEHFNTLEKRYYYMVEKRFVIESAQKMLGLEVGMHFSDSVLLELLKDQSEELPMGSQLNYILGSILVTKFAAFELLLYRLFGRNLIVRREEMPELVVDQSSQQHGLVQKFVVLLMTISVTIRPKLLKCCSAFHVTIFECPETAGQRQLMLEQLERDIRDMDVVLIETRTVRERTLHQAAQSIFPMRINLHKSIRIYDLLNRLSYLGSRERPKHMQAECFVPKSGLEEMRATLKRGALLDNEETSGNLSAQPVLLVKNRMSRQTMPSYFRLNKFTRGFQNLIESYGLSEYKERNPAPYSIITFPFLFAVMFGDMGHGLILILFACLLIFQERRIEEYRQMAATENEILNILFAGRYIILLMGIFSFYVGLIYNDVLALPINLFGSSWSCVFNTTAVVRMTSSLDLDPNDKRYFTGDPYPIGVDPIFKISGEDSITTFNSLKMKLAIILGISQMMFGLGLAAVNCVTMKRKSDLYLVVIPQTIFMTCLFCYLVFLIIFKWLTYGGLKQAPHNSACAPSVLITFIDMMLMKTTEMESDGCKVGMFPHERLLEYVLVIVAFAAVPVLLAGKPIYLMQRQRKLAKKRKLRDLKLLQEQGKNTLREMRSNMFPMQQRFTEQPRASSTTRATDGYEELEIDITEIWIHSGIHTIECVLGSVSHTASYLRLWALSLAHSQLSDVLFEMILAKGLHNNFSIFVAAPLLMASFFIWAVLTVAILVMMEGLSAFLHTLRLHWVEFQSKFFAGTGVAFQPFYFPPSTIRG